MLNKVLTLNPNIAEVHLDLFRLYQKFRGSKSKYFLSLLEYNIQFKMTYGKVIS